MSAEDPPERATPPGRLAELTADDFLDLDGPDLAVQPIATVHPSQQPAPAEPLAAHSVTPPGPTPTQVVAWPNSPGVLPAETAAIPDFASSAELLFGPDTQATSADLQGNAGGRAGTLLLTDAAGQPDVPRADTQKFRPTVRVSNWQSGEEAPNLMDDLPADLPAKAMLTDLGPGPPAQNGLDGKLGAVSPPAAATASQVADLPGAAQAPAAKVPAAPEAQAGSSPDAGVHTKRRAGISPRHLLAGVGGAGLALAALAYWMAPWGASTSQNALAEQAKRAKAAHGLAPGDRDSLAAGTAMRPAGALKTPSLAAADVAGATASPPKNAAGSTLAGDPATTPAATASSAKSGSTATTPPQTLQPAAAEPAGSAWTPPAVHPLDLDNLDSASYADLIAGTTALSHATSGTPFGLLQWARYRLATRFGDRDAGVALLAAHPPKGVHVPLAQAAEVGMLLLSARDATGSAKRPLLRRLAALHPKKLRHTPQLLLAQARAAPPRQWLHAQSLLETALHQAPNMVDALLLHGQAQLRQPAHLDAPLQLVALCRQGDPDVIVAAAQALLQAGETQHLSEALEPLSDGRRIGLAAPQHQDALWSLKVRLHLHRGALAEALAAAKTRVAQARGPQAVRSATLDYAALIASSGGDASVPLQQALLQVSVPAEQAPLLFVRFAQMLRRGSTAEAQAAVQALHALHGNDPQGYAWLAQAQLQEKLGQVSLAQQSYSRAAAAGQGAAQAALLRLANASGTGAAAARAGLQKLAFQRHEPTAFLALAQAHKATGEAARRAAALEAALYYGPAAADPIQVFLDYVDALSSSDQGAKALALAEPFAEAQPTDRRAMILAAQVARQAHVPEAAATRLRSWLATHPQDTAAYLALADTQMDLGHSDQALETLAELSQKNVGARSAEYFYLSARATAATDPAKARSLLQASLALQPQAPAYVLLAEMEQARGKGEEALQAYRQALTLAPQRHEVRLKLAQLLLQRTLVPEALGELQLLLRDHPDNQAAAELLGDALHEQDQDVKAAAAYAQASFGQHASPSALLKLSRLQLRQLGQPRAALTTLRHALAAQPNEPEAVYLLGLAQRDVGATAAAHTAFAQYLRLAPQGEYAAEVREALADLTRN